MGRRRTVPQTLMLECLALAGGGPTPRPGHAIRDDAAAVAAGIRIPCWVDVGATLGPPTTLDLVIEVEGRDYADRYAVGHVYPARVVELFYWHTRDGDLSVDSVVKDNGQDEWYVPGRHRVWSLDDYRRFVDVIEKRNRYDAIPLREFLKRVDAWRQYENDKYGPLPGLPVQ